jgi:predicted O-methyltransferase YrrM
MMNPDLQSLLNELHETGLHHDSQEQDRRTKLLNLEPETAHFLSVLLRSSHRTRVLEIGTSNGYSTIWLAWAMQQTGGHVVSIDREPHKQVMASENLHRAGLTGQVELICGDATEIIRSLQRPFDCVFFDADRRSAPEQLALLLPQLTPEALILADNVHSHPDEIAGYLHAIEQLPQFEHLVVPIGKGLSLAYRQGSREAKKLL